MSFNHILGQKRSLNIVRRMLDAGKIPHAFLFTGIAGVGKYTTARALAKALNCTQHTADFCDTCASCKKIESDMHPDFTLIGPEKNVIKIDQIRNLKKNIAFAPLEAIWRVIIIDQAETMNREAANCLLKTLEEPPSATVLILIANGTIRLLPTILSRCQKISFAPLSKHVIQTLLENEGTTRDQALTVMQHAHGSLHRARMLLDNSLFDDFTHLTSMMIDAGSVGQRLDLAVTLCKSPERLSALLMLLLEWLRDVLLSQHGADTKQFFNTQQSDYVMRAAQQIEPCRLNKKIVQVSQLMTAQNHNISMQLGLESLLLS
jgi:DNA polymerase-3 subunit delta'